MSSLAWAGLRRARYALPGKVGRVMPEPGPQAIARHCRRLQAKGCAATVGYFQDDDAAPEEIVAANRLVVGLLGRGSADVYLSVKAPPLAFGEAHIKAIADAAATAGLSLVFDAHAPKDAERTLDVTERLLPAYPGTGCVLPARWRRSLADADRFKDTSARLRIVKGEWADPDWEDYAIDAAYLALVSRLAGRSAPVAIATHDPALAERALGILLAAGTPCELEQLRGLPKRRTMAVARRLGVPVRVYLPFGPGWWPYAVNKALARPYMLSWMVVDWLAPLSAQAGAV